MEKEDPIHSFSLIINNSEIMPELADAAMARGWPNELSFMLSRLIHCLKQRRPVLPDATPDLIELSLRFLNGGVYLWGEPFDLIVSDPIKREGNRRVFMLKPRNNRQDQG